MKVGCSFEEKKRFSILCTGTGATAAERSHPWRHSSGTDEAKTLNAGSKHGNDPHLHNLPITGADISGAYQKSPESMGEYATTTKPEEQFPRPDVRDLFKRRSQDAFEPQDDDPNESVTRL